MGSQLTRLDALKVVVTAYPDEPYVVALGTMVRELLGLGRRPNHLHVLDSMGLPPAIGLGLSLALAQNARVAKCVVIEGDGGLLMGLSTLATIGLLRPEKLLLVVLDNGTYAATGGQPTASPAVDLCAVACACGMAADEVDNADDLRTALERVRALPIPALLRVRIGPENAPAPYFLPDPVELTLDFQRWLRADAEQEMGPPTNAGEHR